MPNFTESDWSSFKIKFLSVIQWVVYAFNDIFDSVRSHPMLYVFVFFPIFAGVIYVILNFLMNLPHTESGVVISDPRKPGTMQPLKYNTGSKNLRRAHAQHQSVNLAKMQGTRNSGLTAVKAATTKAAAVSSHSKESYSKPAMNLSSIANRAGAASNNAKSYNSPISNAHNFKNTKGLIDFAKGKIDQKRADDKAAQEAYEQVAAEQAKIKYEKEHPFTHTTTVSLGSDGEWHTRHTYTKRDDEQPITGDSDDE